MNLYVCVSKIWGCVNVIKFYMINLFDKVYGFDNMHIFVKLGE